MNVEEMLSTLGDETIHTWFDLGLFIDRFKEDKGGFKTHFSGSYQDFLDAFSTGGMAFITFHYSIDGVSMEIEKYAQAFKTILPDIQLHYISGRVEEKGELLIPPDAKCHQLAELVAFDDWDLYESFFFNKLERGSQLYNELILKFWSQVLTITEKLGNYIQDNDIQLLYLINTNANPGNISLALALVFISEYLGIPVINNNHDFYWEGGHSEIDIQVHGVEPGPRDHFFLNYHLGEVFSILETIFPWESRGWLSVNINHLQSRELINQHGLNPAAIAQIGTAIDIEKFSRAKDEAAEAEVIRQLCAIFTDQHGCIPAASVSDLLKDKAKAFRDLSPILVSASEKKDLDFMSDNIILLQPTRIISRKNIEINFTLISKLFADGELLAHFESNRNLKIALLVTGPIAAGHFGYFLSLLEAFQACLETIQPSCRERVLLGFLFSEFDKAAFKKRFDRPIGIGDLYSVASMVLLPSATEGRGLPILEAAAAGVPVFCRRFAPQEVFAYVVGEHLPPEDQIETLAFTDPQLDPGLIELVKQNLLSNSNEDSDRSKQALEKRYSAAALQKEIETILHRLYLQVTSGAEDLHLAAEALSIYQRHLAANKGFARPVISVENRQYLPGYGQMAFMILLKSLIDPSYFRVEEKCIRGMAMQFAAELVANSPAPLSIEEQHLFYNSVDSLFLHRQGEIPLRMDHSMAYRHRNKRYYPYRDLTPQELTGVINILFRKIASPPPAVHTSKPQPISRDWKENLALLVGTPDIAIDHTDELENALFSNTPLAFFPGDQIELELEIFIRQPLRKRLGLQAGQTITVQHLTSHELAPVFIILPKYALGEAVTAGTLNAYLDQDAELKHLFQHQVCRIVESEQYSVGIHFYELGQPAIEALQEIQRWDGALIVIGEDAAMMTDIAGLHRFHIGRVSRPLVSRIMGIPLGSGYVQRVPAGLRFALSYPVPVQTGKDLSQALKSPRYEQLCDSLGEGQVLAMLKEDAQEKGTPVIQVLKSLEQASEAPALITHTAINGLYADGLPWAGVHARIPTGSSEHNWTFSVLCAPDRTKTVLDFTKEFSKVTGKKAEAAWNGGYILNPELVGKLGLPEVFIGSPLGLIISEGRVLSPPLFNKPAFLILPDGSARIERVNSSQGITLSGVPFPAEVYNPAHPPDAPCFYDLLFPDEHYPGDGRTLVRLSGRTIIDVIRTQPGENAPVLPVGLTLSFPSDQFPTSWEAGTVLEISMNGWEPIASAIEAGPQLLADGEVCIDMELEGWTTRNSIRTQAARLDYLDSRGPKIAVGIDASGDLTILTINGRIRESVGATHCDMAEILKAQGMQYAMGFDPGGSSTLVAAGKVLNISPYNTEFEKDVYALPPQPRAVASVVIVSQE